MCGNTTRSAESMQLGCIICYLYALLGNNYFIYKPYMATCRTYSRQECDARMCTEKEGRVLDKTLLKYYRGRLVEDEDRATLDKLCRASYIEFYSESNRLYARASKTGRSLKPKLGPYLRLIVGRV